MSWINASPALRLAVAQLIEHNTCVAKEAGSWTKSAEYKVYLADMAYYNFYPSTYRGWESSRYPAVYKAWLRSKGIGYD